MEKTISTVVFDLGGVLVDWNPRYLYRKLMNEEEMEWFLKHVCDSEWNDAFDAGKPFAEGIRERSAKYPDKAALIEAYFSRWEEMLGGEIAGTVRLLENLQARGVPLLALSNWSAETFPIAERRFPWLAKFSGKIVSGYEGVKKPDPKIFELLVERYAVAPDRAIFIDDVAKNIAAAKKIGFHTHHFQGPESLGRVLSELNLI